MFYHVKELQFNARVSGPDPAFASLLQEQFGGGNGELKAAIQYFVQAFGMRQPFPKMYDLLMDIATEEFSHLEIVGATITMLLGGTNAELKNAVVPVPLDKIMKGDRAARDELVHQAFVDPQFFALSGGGPKVTNSQGVPWTGAYITANGDPTVDLRSNIAAESRAKIVYEYLMQFTTDPYVLESLRFLLTREIAHFQMFQAALDTIHPNFPPGIRQGDPRFTHVYFNLSQPASARGPWNEGEPPWDRGEWHYIEDPVAHVRETRGMVDQEILGATMTQEEVDKTNEELSTSRSEKVSAALPPKENQWSAYPQEEPESPMGIEDDGK